jgi:ankyrin repeat protein
MEIAMWRRLSQIGFVLFVIFAGMFCTPPLTEKVYQESFYVKGQHKYCVIHHMRLQQDTVPIIYGYVYISEEYREALKNFPNTRTRAFGGCVSSQRSPRTKKVLFCPACRQAEEKWMVAIRAAHKAQLLRRIAECSDTEVRGQKGLVFLSEAAFSGYVDTVTMLIDRGANVKARDEFAGTVLHYAAQAGHADVVKLVIDAGADVNARDSLGRIPLHDAAWFASKASVAMLVENGADINAEDTEGATPLNLAKLFNQDHPDVATYLEDLGAICDPSFIRRIDQATNIDVKNEEGQTLLHEAVSEEYYNAVKKLLQKGCSVNAKNANGETPLHASVWGGNPRVTMLLIDAGADVNAKDDSGETPLHTAARKGFPEAAGILLDAGADINAKDEFGETPLELVQRQGSKEIIVVLRKYIETKEAKR